MSNSLETLITQLQAVDVKQRSQAVLQLQPGTGHDDHAIAALVNVICTDDDLNVVEDATWVLVRHGAAAIPVLLNEIAHTEARARHNIVHALGKIGDGRALPALITATQDAEATVRLKSVYALGQIGDAQAIETLIARLDDPIQNVSWTAREVLETFGDRALLPLIEALTWESAQVRELAANLLGDIADKRAVAPLLAALQTEDWQVRFAIVEALGQIGDSQARPAVEQMLHDPHPAVGAIAKATLKMLKH